MSEIDIFVVGFWYEVELCQRNANAGAFETPGHILHASIIRKYTNVFTRTNYCCAGNRFLPGQKFTNEKRNFLTARAGISVAHTNTHIHHSVGSIILTDIVLWCCLSVRLHAFVPPPNIFQAFRRNYYRISNVNGRQCRTV